MKDTTVIDIGLNFVDIKVNFIINRKIKFYLITYVVILMTEK
jgi:hypothetical protein